ncbi:microfibril-associated glycoprotein 4-like [Antedon mediterranea]|uniref:microfibril-associated glycoprotein 4-like n=1 Tax=Antedon mediterranea TaxID=105859 RepID=UPI003AF6C058
MNYWLGLLVICGSAFLRTAYCGKRYEAVDDAAVDPEANYEDLLRAKTEVVPEKVNKMSESCSKAESENSPTFICQPQFNIPEHLSSGGASACCNCTSGLAEMKQILKKVESRVRNLVTTKKSCFAEPLPRDCSEVLASGFGTSGKYEIKPTGDGKPFDVYCDMDTAGGGWTVVQRRQDGLINFYRGYGSYRRGFGNVEEEFWLGNENLHRLTSQDEYELRIDMEDFEDNEVFANYGNFYVGNHKENFRLRLGEYIGGNAGDSFSYHGNCEFSAKDRNNGGGRNCAEENGGGWWYNQCGTANLNGRYLGGRNEQPYKGIVWYKWKGENYSLKKVTMKLRPSS